MCFLLNIYDWQSYAIKVDTIEIEEFYPLVTVDLSCNSSKFEAFAQDALNLIIQIISLKMLKGITHLVR